MNARWSYSRLARAVAKEVIKELIVSGIILDVGCGFGKSTKMIENKGEYVIGIDLENVFDKTKISRKVDFVLADAINLPFRNHKFDGVISLDVIEHIPDDYAYLFEINRVLKIGGIFLLGTPNRRRLTNRIKAMFGLLSYPMSVGGACIHLREYSKEGIVHLLRSCGFKLRCIREIWLGFPPIDVGLEHFPKILRPFATYILVKSEKV